MNTMLVSNNLFKKSSKSQKIRCEICANYCKIVDGNFGVCKQHKNINGELFNISYGIVSSLSPDPIEKKPLNKFLPGTFTYSIGGFGCNMACLYCQNYDRCIGCCLYDGKFIYRRLIAYRNHYIELVLIRGQICEFRLIILTVKCRCLSRSEYRYFRSSGISYYRQQSAFILGRYIYRVCTVFVRFHTHSRA